MSILISIIVPCYNQAQYLDECLESVLNQTCQNWECLIINDGSTDDTEEIALNWVKIDNRYKYFYKDNGGVASARNLGLENSKGNWILPLDGDDKIGDDYLKLVIEKIKQGYDLIYCKAIYFGDLEKDFNLPHFNYKQFLLQNQIFCSAIFNKEKLSDIRYDSNLIYGLEDWEFWISYLSRGLDINIYCLDKVLFYYRIKKSSRNANVNSDTFKLNASLNYIFKKHIDLYISEFGNFYEIFHKIQNLEKENKFFKDFYNSYRIRLFRKFSSIIKI